ncbi:DUF6365 family protein [uncultured Clostridium sp.]|uniref:DUF6365 family protein n=1 Tax=uncultured Clostridium sp. TaxID=59620 RepID=UPI00258A4ACE|nr:DUF6365 family protein [uncultured Clostridium sp.]MDU1349841.1 DUF6365 family protein [Clostridium argentinense]
MLSDFLNYNFCERHYVLVAEDLKIFSGKLGTFDNFDWTFKKRQMDTYGFPASIASKIDISQYGFKLIPCPIGNYLNHNEPNKYYYSLMEASLQYNENAKSKYRKKLGLPENGAIILVTSATWQETYKHYPNVVDFINASNKCFEKVLEKISENSLIIYVGSKHLINIDLDKTNIKFINNIPPKTFDEYVLACDVFISRNITSTTLAKIAISGIPTLVLKNSLRINKDNQFDERFKLTNFVANAIKDCKEIYPYRMFPVGWFSFLEPILLNNPYMDIVVEEELFDINSILNKIDKLINNNKYREELRIKANEYRKGLDKLDKPEKILNCLMKRSTV